MNSMEWRRQYAMWQARVGEAAQALSNAATDHDEAAWHQARHHLDEVQDTPPELVPMPGWEPEPDVTNDLAIALRLNIMDAVYGEAGNWTIEGEYRDAAIFRAVQAAAAGVEMAEVALIETIYAARREGLTWGAIGDAWDNLSRQGAQQRFARLTRDYG